MEMKVTCIHISMPLTFFCISYIYYNCTRLLVTLGAKSNQFSIYFDFNKLELLEVHILGPLTARHIGHKRKIVQLTINEPEVKFRELTVYVR